MITGIENASEGETRGRGRRTGRGTMAVTQGVEHVTPLYVDQLLSYYFPSLFFM